MKNKLTIKNKTTKRNMALYKTYVQTGDWTKEKFKNVTGQDYK
mgnify:FL=1